MIKTKTKAKQNITKQLKLDLKFFKSEAQIKNINSNVINKRLIKFYDNKLIKVLANIDSVKSHYE